MGLTPDWDYPKMFYHEQQHRLWRTSARFVACACGRGSGKTLLSRRRVIRQLPIRRPWSDPMLFYALPTRDQAKRVAWNKLRALIPDGWVARNGGISLSDMSIKTVFGSQLWVVGMDIPARIEGIQWDFGVIDESCDHKPGSFDRSVRPALTERKGRCWRIGVPKRWGPGAKDFRDACALWGSGTLPDHEAYTWPSHDILTQQEIELAMASMDKKDFDEQFGANWQDTSGLIFHAFDEKLNLSDFKYCPHIPLLVGSDFNVNPMAWVLLQQKPGTQELHVVDELWIRNTNTQAALNKLYELYGTRHQAKWLFFGDATAKARKTSATTSDYVQIVNDKRFVGSGVFYPKSNPAVVNRFAACNRAFCDAAEKRTLFVNPKCTNLIADLGTRAYEEGTRAPDDSAPDAGHITDALGYVIHYLRPVVVTTDAVPQVFTSGVDAPPPLPEPVPV